ncbi:uncharacterized protein LOC118181012 [Stegodyphus dumicola]|uniref:uncharacterized protein LOC118181012 n=1 Tax=Stegodyphus dumicola TaxID=202533 RepID=UPI0015B19729|nr:uncharacterized protein LOC118181012 [Stegodyphus dumicola]
MPLYQVQIFPDKNLEEIYNIKHLMCFNVTVEKYIAKNQVPQCHNCQKWHYSSDNCHVAPRCVKCAGFHKTGNCDKPGKIENPVCVNCLRPHVASYRGCPRFPTYKKVNKNVNTKPGVSYAQATKNSIKTSNASATSVSADAGQAKKQYSQKADLSINASKINVTYENGPKPIPENVNTGCHHRSIQTLTELSSDHNPVMIQVGTSVCSTPHKKAFITNWAGYAKALNNTPLHIPTATTGDELDALVQEFTTNLTTALDANSTPVSHRHKATDSELKKLIQERNAARKPRNDHTRTTPTTTPVKPSEVYGYIEKLLVKKSPGIDKISNKMIGCMGILMLLKLTSIINDMLRLGHYPMLWKTAFIIPILKPGKPPAEPASYRPISLLSSLRKVAEHIILTRLQVYMDLKNVIIPQQHGFRKKQSSVHQLYRVTEYISQGLQERQTTGAIFLDVAKAFDRVWLEGLMHKIISLGFPDYITLHTAITILLS